LKKSPSDINVYLGIGYRNSVAAAERKDIIVAIDVLRCSSSIVTALANGAKAVIPSSTLSEARSLAKRHDAILAGERKGKRPKGFELGNSPLEFKSEVVQGRIVVLTTTSGTKAIVLGKKGRGVLVGSFLNLDATVRRVCQLAEASGSGVSLVTAGKRGAFSLEDFLCAGAISDQLAQNGAELDDGCLASVHAWRDARSDLSSALREGLHARYLASLGFQDDVDFVAKLNLFDIAAVLEKDRIVAVKP